MIRADILRGLMAQKNVKVKYLSDKMGINRNTFTGKMKNGKFGADEIKTLIHELNIPESQWRSIFFFS